MPATSGAQLAAAYAAKGRGESWGARMVAHTPRSQRRSLMRGYRRKSVGQRLKERKGG